MPSGRSRNPFAHILRFVYFTLSACSLVWMLVQYGGVNFISTMILLPAFGYLALHLISLVNVVKKDRFLVGSSVDVLSLGAQKWIHRFGLILPIPILLYMTSFGLCLYTYNANDEASYNRTVEFSAFENAVFGKSVIWNYLIKPEVQVEQPVSVLPAFDVNVRNNVDFQPFMNEMQVQIKRAWLPPRSSEAHHVKVFFKVNKDGYTSDIRFIEHASTAKADEAALKALRNATPFPKLPDGAPDKVDVEFSFDYNMTDPLQTDQFTSYGIESAPMKD
ncbi:MAG: TonB C-terminal domain-containing protein [Candidatus Melainabacteria bacterium]|nr:TonB C-terminal domain-containing protein [Candidatus Melainabacteria bacterium]